MTSTATLPIVVTADVVNAVRAKMALKGLRPASKLAASNEVWRVVRDQYAVAPDLAAWTTHIHGVVVTAFTREGVDGREIAVKIF